METLKKNYEFKQVLKKGKYYSSNNVESFIRKNNIEYNRVGMAISVKIAKATKRNKIKRLIRENYRSMEGSLKQGYDIVFLWKKKSSIEEATYDNIQREIKQIMRRSNMLEEVK